MGREGEEQLDELESTLLAISGGEEDELGLPMRKQSLVVQEMKRQVRLAGPLMLVTMVLYCVQVISVMFVGHLGELPLSGASMATSFASVTGFSLLSGMGSTLDTLCGQAYGAKQYRMVGIQMQRAMIVLFLVSVPIALVWANTGRILIAIGQDPEIAREAGQYASFMIPSIFAYGLLQCHIRFLQAQNNVFPMMISAGCATLLHIFVCWILVFKSGLGNKGAALANATTYWINLLMLACYVNFSSACKKTWPGLSRETFHDVLYFLKLAIPSAIMICLEIWTFELVVLLSGFLPNPKLETSVLSISLNLYSVVYTIPFGLGGAVSTRVSNELGAGRPQAARLAVRTAIFSVITIGIVLGSILILMRRTLGYCYSNEKEVVNYVTNMIPLLALSHLLDGFQAVLSGTARGCGWQKIGALVNLGAFYLIGVPSGILLAFVFKIGGQGLWLGIICGLFVQGLLLLIITLRADWEQQAKKATDRLYNHLVATNSDS
ncbi:hypothetical protein Syun_003323 [Stephania yunnanensis]|uniref:Protein DETOXIFICATION n=1 Tax=Stephania yunnanensis TaxID=152371 RepID=A0AAP0L179_9MAGN